MCTAANDRFERWIQPIDATLQPGNRDGVLDWVSSPDLFDGKAEGGELVNIVGNLKGTAAFGFGRIRLKLAFGWMNQSCRLQISGQQTTSPPNGSELAIPKGLPVRLQFCR